MVLSGFIVFFAVAVAAGVFAGIVPSFVPGLYAVASILTFAVYASDKSAARSDRWRTPERTLHMLSLAGGWPGAVIAQRVLHHKSRKRPFRIVFYVTVTVNCSALLFFAYLRAS